MVFITVLIPTVSWSTWTTNRHATNATNFQSAPITNFTTIVSDSLVVLFNSTIRLSLTSTFVSIDCIRR